MNEKKYLPFDGYLSCKYISSHDIGLICKSWNHYKNKSGQQKKCYDVGSLVHAITLEPESVFERFAIAPDCDKRTTVGKKTHAEFESLNTNANKKIVSINDYKQSSAMAQSIQSHPVASSILSQKKEVEMSYFWTNKNCINCKCRPDITCKDLQFIADIKTTDDASEFNFARDCIKYGYHIQAAHYLSGCSVVDGVEYKKFILIVVEKNEPYDVMIYDMDTSFFDIGNKKIELAMQRFIDNQMPGKYQGRSDQIITLYPPAYAVE